MLRTNERLNHLDWDLILDRLAGFATCGRTREQLRQLGPLTSPAEAQKSFSEISETMEILTQGRRPFAESLDLYPIWQQRLSKNSVLKTMELRDVRHFCLEVIALQEILKPRQTGWLADLRAGLMTASEPLSAIDQIMTPEGDIRTDASETLFRLYNEKNQIIRQTQSMLDKLIRQHDMETVLQDRYVTNREGRWVLPIRSGRQHAFEGIIHASSQSKQTVFMEPKEVVPLNNRLRQVEVDIEEEIERLLRQLSEYLHSRLSHFESSAKLLTDMDIRFAQGQLAVHTEGRSCRFVEGEIHLESLKHPLLLLANVDVISNSVVLNKQKRILLLSGPNAGGKTVLLKAVGLAAQMARCGLLISAAPDSRLPFFETLHVAIGDAQSVDQHLSTFAAHLKVLNEAANSKGPNTLLLIDEICGSTDPEEGTALARAFIRKFAEHGCFAVITSHLGPLKLGWDEDSGLINGSLEYDAKSGRPTYQFLMGIPGQSLAIQTARRVGVQEEIVKLAMEFLSPESKRHLQSLDEIERVKSDLHLLSQETKRQQKDAQKLKEKYEKMTAEFERDREKRLERALEKAEKKIEGMLENTAVEDVFRRHERLEQIRQGLPEIVKASTASKKSAPEIETAEDFAKAYPAGTKVFAPTIGRDAVVQSEPTSKGDVAILSGSMRLSVHFSQLRSPLQAQNQTSAVVRRSGDSPGRHDPDRTIDLRGRSLEEAIGDLESQLDTATMNKEDRVRIIHGHGSETLKRGVRQFLSRSVYVKNWKAGTADSGGDGVTWVELRD
ncbi:MAG: Smr/MutS family protein [Bdellovibrionales bacterium]